MMGRTTHTLEKPSGSHYRLEDTSDTSWISRESQPTCCWSSILLFWCDVGYWRCTSSLDQEACALHGRSSAPSFGCAGALVLKLAVCESHLVIGAEVTVFFNSFSTQWSARKCKENDVCVCVSIHLFQTSWATIRQAAGLLCPFCLCKLELDRMWIVII